MASNNNGLMRGMAGLAYSVQFGIGIAVACALITGLGACGHGVDTTVPAATTSSEIFDWIDSNTRNAKNQSPAKPKTASNNAQPEIYYGSAVSTETPNLTNIANAEIPERIVPARLASVGPLGSVNDGFQTAQAPRDGPSSPSEREGLTRTQGNGINLNFENADLKTVARAILGDVLNLNYAIDPRVTGTISLSTRRPVSREQLLPLLEGALRAQGAVLARDYGTYRIMPATEAAGMGQANVGRDAGGEGFGITALPLENISSEALLKIIDGFGSRTGSARVDKDRNLLIVQGTFAERQSMIDTALAFDVDWMKNQSVGVFPVRNASPDAVISELSKLADENVVRFQPIPRMNAILAISRSPQAIKQVSSWVQRLDRLSENGIRVRVYRLRYGDARRVAQIIREAFGVGGTAQSSVNITADQTSPGSTAVTARVASVSPVTPGGSGQTPPPVGGGEAPPGGPLGGADANAPRIRITADVSNNSVVVYAGQPDAQLIERAIIDLDRPTVQVAIEATIAEITLNDSLSNGVQFFLTSKNRGSLSSQATEVPLPLTRVAPGLNLLLGSDTNPKLVLDALRQVTDVKVLSSPSLVVMNNQPAILQVGDQVPITTRTAQDVTVPNAPIVNSIDFRDTGVILRVTPHVHAGATVAIDVEQEISSVKNSSTAATLTPTISQRKVKSTVTVSDRQTLLLGGLISEQRTKDKSGIPGIVDIPVLGNLLASANTDSNTRTELIIFIKPQVIVDMIDARNVAEDLRRRLKGFERW